MMPFERIPACERSQLSLKDAGGMAAFVFIASFLIGGAAAGDTIEEPAAIEAEKLAKVEFCWDEFTMRYFRCKEYDHQILTAPPTTIYRPDGGDPSRDKPSLCPRWFGCNP